MQNTLLIISLGLCMGYFTQKIAEKKGLHPRVWFLLGFSLLIFAPMYLIFIHPFFERKKIIKEAQNLVKVNPRFENIDWYYLDHEHDQRGPYSFNAFKVAFEQGLINQETLIWNEDMSDWKELKEEEEVFHILLPSQAKQTQTSLKTLPSNG